MSANGSWNGTVALVSSGVADIGIGDFAVTKERSEVVAFTDILLFER
jgi:ABC-type amino acid transport substrate-binding protein